MATQTLAEAAKLIQDDLISGIAEDIISINPLFDLLPFQGFEGQGFIFNREMTLGGAEFHTTVGATISATAKAASAVTQLTVSAIKLIGDAEIDGLVQATSQGAGVDQVAIEVSSKAKNISRMYQKGLAGYDYEATAAVTSMNSIPGQVDATQVTTAATTAGRAISFVLLDELLDLVKSKDGQVDFIMMAPRTIRSYKVLLRALGGTPAEWVVTLPGGRTTIGYEGIPIFKNEYLSVEETVNAGAITGGAMTSVYAGVFDDGTRKIGVSGVYPVGGNYGINVEAVGAQEAKDVKIWRVKWYTNFINFNRRGLARLTSITN